LSDRSEKGGYEQLQNSLDDHSIEKTSLHVLERKRKSCRVLFYIYKEQYIIIRENKKKTPAKSRTYNKKLLFRQQEQYRTQKNKSL
jgi:hypothetical protein